MTKTKKGGASAPPLISKPYRKRFHKPSLTKQSFKDECDVNRIMKNFEKTGHVDHLNNRAKLYGDFANAEDYHSSVNLVMDAQKSFDALPSEVRLRFDNQPAKFLEFANNPENMEELKTLGLTKTLDNPISSIASAIAEKLPFGSTPPEPSTSQELEKSTPKT